jgi:predicted secreted Zn-dependent protease
MPNDPRPHSAEDRELRKRLDEISQRRAQREREWDALLAARDRQIHQTGMAAELEAKIKASGSR